LAGLFGGRGQVGKAWEILGNLRQVYSIPPGRVLASQVSGDIGIGLIGLKRQNKRL